MGKEEEQESGYERSWTPVEIETLVNRTYGRALGDRRLADRLTEAVGVPSLGDLTQQLDRSRDNIKFNAKAVQRVFEFGREIEEGKRNQNGSLKESANGAS